MDPVWQQKSQEEGFRSQRRASASRGHSVNCDLEQVTRRSLTSVFAEKMFLAQARNPDGSAPLKSKFLS
jgi:hypothetical protein